ncbi:diadenylate cyclase CdaA [Porcipelethomonas sp.]|uniref:diadenylate cyclase CdaA n=1 Tax=Porcipelethomonas sp. TaxID=2981675 RepID=UPI003EF262EF
MYAIKNVLNMIWNVIQTITIMDIVDILLMSYLVYLAIKLIRETRANQLIKGILIIAAAYIVSTTIGLKSISYIIKSILDVGLLAILIMFQPEIRRALEKAGRAKFGINFLNFSDNSDELTKKWNTAIEAICDSCVDLSASKTGALIVIERKTKLGEQIENGTILNANPSKELFGNIFYPNTPLHDGAVIMRDGIILAAACFLPKPQKEELINKKLGSRHRAAIGMSENSDAIIIVVSEETGQISIAENGVLVRDYTRFMLNEYLHEAILPKPADTKKKFPVRRFFSKGDDKK